MKTVSSYFNDPRAFKMDRDNQEKYGTSDLDTIDLIEKFANKNVEKRSEEIADTKAEARFNAIKGKFELDTIRKTKEAFLIKKGELLSVSSPFVSDYADLNGKRLFREDFIPSGLRRDPLYADRRLELNAYSGDWQKKSKNKGPEFISGVQVIGGFIVNASAAGVCDSIEIYIKGRDTPLHFPGGNLSTHNIVKSLQLEDKSLEQKWVAEAFKRSLILCPNIKFLNIPEHMGGNRLPDGTLTYVSAASVLPGLEAHFSKKIQAHRLIPEADFNVLEYINALPQNWKVKAAVVDRVTSVLLPFYEDEGLRPDRVKIISYENEAIKHGIIAVSKRVNYESTIVGSLSDRCTDVRKDLSSANDVTMLYTYSSTIEGRGACDNRFTDIRLTLNGENGIEDPTRKLITILTNTPGSIPADLPAYYLSVDEDIDFGDTAVLQELTGRFDSSFIDFIYSNQGAARLIVHSALEKAYRNAELLKNVETTQSMIMFLATAHILKKIGLVSEGELLSMLRWFSNTATSSSTAADRLSYDIRSAVNSVICSGKLWISRQYGPPYYRSDGKTAFIGEIDGSVNVEVETFDRLFLANIKSTERRNLVLRTLSEKRYLISTKDYRRDLKVRFENDSEAPVRVYSLSSAILSDESKSIVDKALISDRFHAFDKRPDHFYPFIVHPKYGLAAGQVIKDYNTINPFIAVSGSPGSGKTDFLMMQALQRAEAGDVVVILDPTNSFCEHELRAHMIPQRFIDSHFKFWDMSVKGWPIDLLDFSGCMNREQHIERLSSLLISGSHFTGCNQLCILNGAVRSAISLSGNTSSSIKDLLKMVLAENGKEGEVRKRLISLFSTVANNTEPPPGWDKLLADRGKIVVISVGKATVKTDCNPLDMVADHLYSYKDSHRSGNLTLILDEIQTMNLNPGAPIDVLLSKGRKLNISAFLASQRYSGGREKLGRVFDYCDTKFFFTPMESCIEAVADKTRIPVDRLRCFDQGECAFVGPSYSEYFGRNIPVRLALIGRTYRPPYVGSYDKN